MHAAALCSRHLCLDAKPSTIVIGFALCMRTTHFFDKASSVRVSGQFPNIFRTTIKYAGTWAGYSVCESRNSSRSLWANECPLEPKDRVSIGTMVTELPQCPSKECCSTLTKPYELHVSIREFSHKVD